MKEPDKTRQNEWFYRYGYGKRNRLSGVCLLSYGHIHKGGAAHELPYVIGVVIGCHPQGIDLLKEIMAAPNMVKRQSSTGPPAGAGRGSNRRQQELHTERGQDDAVFV